MRASFATFLIALLALPMGATAQSDPKNAAPAACPAPAEVTQLQLYGLWQARFDGLAQDAVLLLEKHPDYPESVRGSIRREGPGNPERALVSGDVDEGVFTLDESADGRTISATWSGTVVEQSCGKEIRGTWTHTQDHTTRGFVLRKLPGWQ